jgi:micrococcal nuclease
MYEYIARINKVVDGDTIDFIVDLGFGILNKIRVRLLNIDTWEVRGPNKEKGLKAKKRVQEIFEQNPFCVIQTYKDKRGKYGRYLAEVFICLDDKDYNLADILSSEGHCKS